MEFNEMSFFGLAFLFFFSKYQVEIVFNLQYINKVQSNILLETNLKSNSTITLTYYVTSSGGGLHICYICYKYVNMLHMKNETYIRGKQCHDIIQCSNFYAKQSIFCKNLIYTKKIK